MNISSSPKKPDQNSADLLKVLQSLEGVQPTEKDLEQKKLGEKLGYSAQDGINSHHTLPLKSKCIMEINILLLLIYLYNRNKQ